MPKLESLISRARACILCEDQLPLGCRPILRGKIDARILIVGQAPGIKVHESGVPWDDASGKRLREWLGLSSDQFYDENNIAILPAGLCYPGKGKSGDLPPIPACAPLWHSQLRPEFRNVQLTLLIGMHAQNYYLKNDSRKTLTETVKNWRQYSPDIIPLPHPSPRNVFWLKRNPWFEIEVLPELQRSVRRFLPEI
jgi:uracil-DNA glycosylase